MLHIFLLHFETLQSIHTVYMSNIRFIMNAENYILGSYLKCYYVSEASIMFTFWQGLILHFFNQILIVIRHQLKQFTFQIYWKLYGPMRSRMIIASKVFKKTNLYW